MNKEEIYQKIREILPEMDESGIDVNVVYDDENNRWCISLRRDGKELKTFLEPGDAKLCIDGTQCMSLGIEINQLKDNMEQMPSYSE